MIDLTKFNLLKYPLFGSLSFANGLGFSLLIVIIPVYFVEKGISLPTITLVTGIAIIPWTIKFVWGGIVDYFIRFGRKRFILLGGSLGAIGLLILAFINPVVALIPFLFFLFLVNIGTAFFDVSADAWAIEISHREERGKITGVKAGGYFSGMAIGSSLYGHIAHAFDYSYVFIITGLIIIMIIIFPLLIKEAKIVRKGQKVRTLLISEFKRRTSQLVAIFAPIAAMNIGLLMFLIPLYMKTILLLDITQIGVIAAIYPAMKVVGALFIGGISDKWGRKNTLYVIIGLCIFFSASFIFAKTWQILAILYGTIGFLHSGFDTAFGAMFMDITNPKIGATQFSIFTSLANFGWIFIGALSGSFTSLLGFDRMFLYSAWLLGPALLILYFIKLKS